MRPFSGSKGNSGIESLLEDVTDRQIEEAISLVNGKVINLIFLVRCTNSLHIVKIPCIID